MGGEDGWFAAAGLGGGLDRVGHGVTAQDTCSACLHSARMGAVGGDCDAGIRCPPKLMCQVAKHPDDLAHTDSAARMGP